MTAAQLTKMREGRERQLAEQRQAAREAVSNWRQWLVIEREAFQRYMAARRDNADVEHIAELREDWQAVLKRGVMPRDSQFALA